MTNDESRIHLDELQVSLYFKLLPRNLTITLVGSLNIQKIQNLNLLMKYDKRVFIREHLFVSTWDRNIIDSDPMYKQIITPVN